MVSIWEKETFYAPQDIIIAGSGLVGLWSAFYLKKRNPDLRMTVLERGWIPSGASTRNAGFACFGSLSEVIADARVSGTDKMLELVEMRFKGLERIHKYFGQSAIDYDLCGGYELYDPAKTSSEELNNSIAYINSLLRSITGSKHTYRLANEKIPEFGFGNTSQLVQNQLEGYLHPGKLIQCLLAKVQGMGVQVFNQTTIQSYEHKESGIEIRTNLPESFRASQLLLCTNAFTSSLFPSIAITPARGQVLLTSPIEGLPFEGTFHSDEGYYYFRNLDGRVLLGGARNKAVQDETTIEMETSSFIQEELQKYLDEVVLPSFKGRYQVEHRWAGIMAMGPEKLPIVEELEPDVFCAVRMSGMGVALSPVVGRQVARMIASTF
jgi:gamma-glutamylputrescine oxidase